MPPRRQRFSSLMPERVPALASRLCFAPPASWKRALLTPLLGLSLIALNSAAADRPDVKTGSLPTSPELERLRTEAKEAERGLLKGEAHFALEMKKAHVYA